ncbi:M15 family metallopeptidase [Lacinutrix salivirga]
MTKKITTIIIAVTILVFAIPQLNFSQENLSYEELIGKGSPQLFGNGYTLRKEAQTAFEKMKTAALKEGIKIHVVSSYRGFEHQKRIWNRKYNRYINQGLSETDAIKKIIEYSTIPGTSRHHWGTDLDIIDANVKQPSNVLSPSHFNNNGVYCPLKEWMDANANTYGFYLVYTNTPNRKGFKYEPWHYTYKPLSNGYLKQYRDLDFTQLLKKEKLKGYNAFTNEFINKYLNENILDINPELL